MPHKHHNYMRTIAAPTLISILLLPLCISCKPVQDDSVRNLLPFLAQSSPVPGESSSTGSYTAIGTTQCADGYTAAYTGLMHAAAVSYNNGSNSTIQLATIFCSANETDFQAPLTIKVFPLKNNNPASLTCAMCVK